jgi:alginate O-acetyltransferase complex protein AlgI
MAATTDAVFTVPTAELGMAVAWLGIVTFTLQAYFDFSGYSDMAIGLGRMFGFHFPENFDHPYVCTSVTDYWRRWHISLSLWFRDYLFIPLGGSKGGHARAALNLLVVFFLAGLWHGARWTFVLWGLYQGVFLVMERLAPGKLIGKAPRPLRHAYAMLVAMFGEAMFRSPTLTHAFGYLRSMVAGGAGSPRYALAIYLDWSLLCWILVAAVASLPVRAALMRWNASRGPRVALVGEIGERVALGVILLAATMEVAASTYNPFIYFRF